MIIYNKLIPFKGYKLINLFGIIFARSNSVISSVDINHEKIHTAQMKETLYIGFYLIYIVSWIYNLLRGVENSYREILFEQEAYNNQSNLDYLSERQLFAWLK